MAAQTVSDVMTTMPISVSSTAPVSTAAETMRDNDIGDVLVTEDGKVAGLVTDRDLVVRVLAGGMDPSTTMVGHVCSTDLVAAHPDTPVDEVIQVMRERAVRRLPVINDTGEAIGFVSLGDLAVNRDPRSALADISMAPPNR
jgi:CBS domain-containing protein